MGKYTATFACHDGTITGRDSVTNEYDTEAEARNAFQQFKKYIASIGYVLWYAIIRNTAGEKVMHINGEPYSR